MPTTLKPVERYREAFSFANSAEAIRRFPFPFPEDRYQYSVNIEPAVPREPGSVFEHHRRLIALRHEEPAVARGDFTLLLPDHDQLFAFIRSHEGTELVVVANFPGQPAVLPAALLERCSGAELVIGGSAGADLLPWESRVYRRPAATVELPVG